MMKKYNRFNLDEVHTEDLYVNVKNSLEKKGFSVIIMDDISKIGKLIEKEIPDESLVGLDGSEVIEELNIPGFLRKNWNVIVDPFQKGLAPEIRGYLMEKLPVCEYYLTIADLVTMDGKIVFKNKNSFLSSCESEKPENVLAFVGSSQIVQSIESTGSKFNAVNSTILEVSPYGLKRGLVDNYGQMEEYHDFMAEHAEKQRNFTIVLLVEEHVY